MTEQDRLDKVIRGLECRLDVNGCKYRNCLHCDYRHDIDHCQWACQVDGILEDTLAMLKSMEPRVMTLNDVKNLKYNDVVWLEDYDKEDVIPAIVTLYGAMSDCIDFAISNRSSLVVEYADYGLRWRCWSHKPTKAQMEATPWQERVDVSLSEADK